MLCREYRTFLLPCYRWTRIVLQHIKLQLTSVGLLRVRLPYKIRCSISRAIVNDNNFSWQLLLTEYRLQGSAYSIDRIKAWYYYRYSNTLIISVLGGVNDLTIIFYLLIFSKNLVLQPCTTLFSIILSSLLTPISQNKIVYKAIIDTIYIDIDTIEMKPPASTLAITQIQAVVNTLNTGLKKSPTIILRSSKWQNL